MKQNISTLMDGELCDDEAEALLAKLKQNPEAQQEWLTYHLIGDSLRQHAYVPGVMSERFLERLNAEPTVLAPHNRRNSKAGYFAMSAVASVVAIAFLTWLSVQVDSGPGLQQARQNLIAAQNTGLPYIEGMDDYLLAHREFSPSTDVRGAASYIRTVSVQRTVAGQ